MRATLEIENDWDRLLGPRQVTRISLWAFAVKQGRRFVTFASAFVWIWRRLPEPAIWPAVNPREPDG